MPTFEDRTRFPRGDDLAHVRPPADDDAGRRRALDHIARDRRVGLDGDAIPALVDRLVLAPEEIAHQVALHDGKAAAFVEVGDGDARRRRVDDVVGDQRALESELGINGDFAQTRAGIADDLHVGGGIAAHRGKGAIADAVAGDKHAAGPE